MNFLRRPGTLLVIAAVAVHLALLTVARVRTGTIDGYAFRSLDGREYYTIARNLAKRATFSQDDPAESGALEPDTWRTPGYPLFLALVMLVLGPSPAALIVVQQFLAILNVWLLYRIARAMMSDHRAALAAGLFLLEPYHLYYSLWLLATTWFTTVLLVAWLTWNSVCTGLSSRTDQRAAACAMGALLGISAGFLLLIRPVALLIPPLLLIGILIRAWRGRGPDTKLAAGGAASAACFLVFSALPIGGWMARNAAVAGNFTLSHQSGVVLAYFKAAEVELWRRDRTADRYLETSLDPARRDRPHTVWEEIDNRLRQRLKHLPQAQRDELRWPNLAQGNRTSVDSFEISKALSGIGWSMLTAEPLSTVTCCAVRCVSILTFPLNLAVNPPSGVAVNRLRSALMGALYLLLVLAALIRLFRGRYDFCAVYFPVAAAIALLLATTPQVDPRFRVPMVPLLLALALMPFPAPLSANGDPAAQERFSESSRASSS